MIHVVWDFKTSAGGDEGWCQRGQPDFDPPGADFTFAHDALEHFPARHGHVADECIALGALLRGRGLAGAFDMGAPKALAYELERFFADMGWLEIKVPPSHTGPMRGDGRDGEELLQEALDIAQRMALDSYAPSERLPDFYRRRRELRTKVAAWMRIGYRKAESRFHDATPWHIYNLFENVRLAMQPYVQRGEAGATLHLSVDPRRLAYDVRMNDPYGY